MKKRRILLSVISLVLIFTFTVSLSSCFGTDDNEANESESSQAAGNVTLYGEGVEGYKIVYPKNPDTDLREAALALRTALEEITGQDVKFVSEDSKKEPESAREIVIGKTSRAVTEAAAERLRGSVGYRYDMIDGKLVVLGNSDYLTVMAIESLINNALKVEGGTVSVPADLASFTDMSDKMTALIVDAPTEEDPSAKGFLYRLIVPNGNNAMRQAASNFCTEVESILNAGNENEINVRYTYDSNRKPVEGEREILVGQTNRAMSSIAYADLGYFSYRVMTKDQNILVAALKEDMVVNGLTDLLNYIREAYRSSIDGNCWIPSEINLNDDLYGWTNEVPNAKNVEFGGIYDSGDGSYVVQYTDATKSEYGAYIETLTNQGFTTEKTYTLGNNSYALMKGKESVVYVTHVSATRELRVAYDKGGAYNYPTASRAGEEGTYTPTLWQLRVDNYGSRENGGMSYVIRMSNGHFIVIDGGYNTPEEADNLYNFLKMKAPEGTKPVVEAWFISHLHGDHYGAFLSFTEKYANQIELQGIYYNFLKDSSMSLGPIKPIQDAAKKWNGCTMYEKVRTGMTLEFTGVDIDVVCTHEDVYPNKHVDANDTSTVLKVTVEAGGRTQSMMFLADCRDRECDAMLANFGDTDLLKCDIVQWSHHGYEGATKAIYEAIAAHTILFPLNVVGWQSSGYSDNPAMVFLGFGFRTDYPCGNYITTSENTKNIIIAGMADKPIEGTEFGMYSELVLPYTPKNLGVSGISNIINYYENAVQTYYNEHKNDRPPYEPHSAS